MNFSISTDEIDVTYSPTDERDVTITLHGSPKKSCGFTLGFTEAGEPVLVADDLPPSGPPDSSSLTRATIMMTATERVDEALKQASIPFYGVYQDEEENWVIDFKPEATTQQRSDAVTIIAGLDLSEAGLAARENVRERERAADVIQNSIDKEEKLLKAVLLVALDEVNTIREWLASFKTEVAAATSLSDLKTRVGNLPAMPDRTAAQVKSAVLSKLSSGAAD